MIVLVRCYKITIAKGATCVTWCGEDRLCCVLKACSISRSVFTCCSLYLTIGLVYWNTIKQLVNWSYGSHQNWYCNHNETRHNRAFVLIIFGTLHCIIPTFLFGMVLHDTRHVAFKWAFLHILCKPYVFLLSSECWAIVFVSSSESGAANFC